MLFRRIWTVQLVWISSSSNIFSSISQEGPSFAFPCTLLLDHPVILLPVRELLLVLFLTREGTKGKHALVVIRSPPSHAVHPTSWVWHDKRLPALSADSSWHFNTPPFVKIHFVGGYYHYTTASTGGQAVSDRSCIVVTMFCINAGPPFNFGCIVLIQHSMQDRIY